MTHDQALEAWRLCQRALGAQNGRATVAPERKARRLLAELYGDDYSVAKSLEWYAADLDRIVWPELQS